MGTLRVSEKGNRSELVKKSIPQALPVAVGGIIPLDT